MGNASNPAASSRASPVHPHVHGERAMVRFVWFRFIGSSPRAWGTRCRQVVVRRLGRFIPTCMGNARISEYPPKYSTVHPHVHGERGLRSQRTGGAGGSSPRAWGTLGTGQLDYAVPRFIPTCMGNARLHSASRWSTTVHPHVHGERGEVDACAPPRRGSSPRAWGTRWYRSLGS